MDATTFEALSKANDPEIREVARAAWGAGKQRRKWEAADRQMQRVYGIDAEDWARLYESQAGLCAGCARTLSMGQSTHIDHCHTTGKVRGLLCTTCNTTLGAVKDSPETLRSLATYIEVARWEHEQDEANAAMTERLERLRREDDESALLGDPDDAP